MIKIVFDSKDSESQSTINVMQHTRTCLLNYHVEDGYEINPNIFHFIQVLIGVSKQIIIITITKDIDNA